MAYRDQIGTTRMVSISGRVTKGLPVMPEHHLHDVSVELAAKENNGDFLRLADPAEGLNFEIPAAAFLGWLDSAGTAIEFLKDLQRIAETEDGGPLLTYRVSWSHFEGVLAEREDAFATALKEKTQGWNALNLDEVFFDFFEKPSIGA